MARRGRPRKQQEVPDSSSQPSEIQADPSPRISTGRRTLAANPVSKRSTRQSTSTTASAIASPYFSSETGDYETPDTSGIGTPLDFSRRSSERKQKRNTSGFVVPSNTLRMSSERKRTRSLRALTDAELAKALQEQEYMQIDNSSDESVHAPLTISDSEDELRPRAAKRRKRTAKSEPKALQSGRASARKARSRMVIDLDGSTDSAEEANVAKAHDTDEDDDGPIWVPDDESDAMEVDEDDDVEDDDDRAPTLAALRGRHQSRRRGEPGSRKQRERMKLERSHPEIATMWDMLEKVPKITMQEAAQPASITRQLKSFQLEGLNWMIKQEQTQWKGGLLGDEMGMGKTIQAVSLIMSDYPAKEPTLVVVPPVALMQWTNEINEYTNGKLKVLVFHGTNAKAKKMSVKELKQFDVIMISYSGLESIHRKETKGWSRQHTIVKEDSPIHAIHFHRLILDEAHSIKQRTTGVARACFALKGSYKWCLSGTPVQNRIGEFFSLLRFLEVEPFANYACKSCPCSSMQWKVDEKHLCVSCGHRQLEHVSLFNQEILHPIISPDDADNPTSRKAAFAKLRLLTERIMLRRMKRDHTASMELPPKEVIIHNEFFGEIEKDFANSIMGASNRTFDTYVSRGVMLDNYANIFGLIMQMRQVADHPDLITKKRAEGGQNVLVCNICDEPAEEAIRSKCKHDFCRECAKDFVKTCENSGATPDCPRCHIALTIDFDQPDIEQDEENVKSNSIINRIKMDNWTSSTKIEMLVYDLWKLRSPKQTTKSIVFSQFTSMLQLVEWRLRRAGFNTVMLDGSMSPAQRQKSIDHFMNNADVEVFLVSLKAGGVALNLTEASRIFIIDPWWNPAAEWQSADRCHRIGQRRPCVITRLVVEDSIESRIVLLQEKKAHMINGTINNDDVSMEKLTPQDMQFLFRGS